MEAAIESGAEDVIVDDDMSIEVLTEPAEFESVRDAMREACEVLRELANFLDKVHDENVDHEWSELLELSHRLRLLADRDMVSTPRAEYAAAGPIH